jgi:hypothetical protein
MPFIVADLKLSSCIADYGLVRSAAEDESAMVGEGQATAFVVGFLCASMCVPQLANNILFLSRRVSACRTR